ncbi:glycine zipper 2TM domain-containing protein [Fusibacter sp. 3D3]|uniref:glycine zipper 2TM domain-containing protein n=1 Tax=Fusibacter sp. 3D3 TaxID=1048380 RepID=UPI0008534449|nr:glycine zipper 2TM domain-containing protein [Fusibacter sp. 3D3]GAU76485.1 hypothetical protein F3D3_1082 [Fusibacter sp. 3D3]
MFKALEMDKMMDVNGGNVIDTVSDITTRAMDTFFESVGAFVGGSIGFAASSGPNYKTEKTIGTVAGTAVGAAVGSSIGGSISDAIQEKLGWN